MDVTTVGSNIIAVTVTGRVLSVLLAALGMMMFPIFTVYVTSLIQKRTKRKRSIINNWRQLMKVSQNNCSGISMPKNTAHLHVADGQYPN